MSPGAISPEEKILLFSLVSYINFAFSALPSFNSSSFIDLVGGFCHLISLPSLGSMSGPFGLWATSISIMPRVSTDACSCRIWVVCAPNSTAQAHFLTTSESGHCALAAIDSFRFFMIASRAQRNAFTLRFRENGALVVPTRCVAPVQSRAV